MREPGSTQREPRCRALIHSRGGTSVNIPKLGPAQDWASEYECDFITSGVNVFTHDQIEACADGWLGLLPPTPGREYAYRLGYRPQAGCECGDHLGM